jgi:hypothetical protein
MGTMPPNPENCNTNLRESPLAVNKLVVEPSRGSGRSVLAVEQVIRGHVTTALETAVVAVGCIELRIWKPEAIEC